MNAPRPTDKQILWLVQLRDHGPRTREGWASIPFKCRRQGWTEWLVKNEEGELITWDTAKSLYGDDAVHRVKFTPWETITDAGRAIVDGFVS